MPYHVRVTQKSNPSRDEIRLDLSGEELRTRFLTPYEQGRAIVIAGKTISPDDLERIKISYTEETSDRILPVVEAERRASSVVVIGGPSDEWYVANKGKDVTDEFIIGPPGSGTIERHENAGPSIKGPRVVFVVHGRNAGARDSLFDFFRSLGLHPLEWAEAVDATGKSSPYIGEILEKAFDIAQAIVVLMTPDDEGQLRDGLRESGEPAHETTLTPQARLNVVFEAGMAMGRDPDRTVLVELGSLRPFSDVAGRHTIRLNNSTPRRQELALRLQTAGCPVSLTGTDWHRTGDFEGCLKLQ